MPNIQARCTSYLGRTCGPGPAPGLLRCSWRQRHLSGRIEEIIDKVFSVPISPCAFKVRLGKQAEPCNLLGRRRGAKNVGVSSVPPRHLEDGIGSEVVWRTARYEVLVSGGEVWSVFEYLRLVRIFFGFDPISSFGLGKRWIS